MIELPIATVHQEESCVRRVPIFNRLPAAQQDQVASFARPVHLKRGELLHGAGMSVGQLFVVHTGQLKLVHVSESGRTQLVRVANPGDAVGEHAFLTGSRPDYQVEALTDAQLCTFSHADLAKLLASYPVIAQSMLRSLSERLNDAERRLALSGVEVSVRLAGYLLDLPATDGNHVELPLSKKDIASYLGTTPESFSRALAKLHRDGLINVAGSTIELVDFDALDELSATQ